MKTIGTRPTKAAGARPDLIEDASAPKLAGKGTAIGDLVGSQSPQTPAEIDFAQEEAHWRENHASQPFANGRSYEDFSPAYRAGFEGYSLHGAGGKTFDETETELRERYESENGSPKLPWTVARDASHAAWHRAARKK
jgi:hypothetical protein